jgi:hypothetical protein
MNLNNWLIFLSLLYHNLISTKNHLLKILLTASWRTPLCKKGKLLRNQKTRPRRVFHGQSYSVALAKDSTG